MNKIETQDVDFLGITTLKRMLDAVYNENDPLYSRNIYSECVCARADVESDPQLGDEVVYVYYHDEENISIMTNIEGDFCGWHGSSAGFKGKIQL
jgi:hypothetical protein